MGLAGTLAALTLAAGLITGVGSRASAHDEESHPAHIHTGSCPTPGDVVFPLSNVGADFSVDGTPMAGAETVGSTSAVPVDASVTTVKSSLADLVAGEHAIVVHESAANIQNYIACGDVGGAMLGASDLPIGLAPLNDSGYSGVAWLHDNGDGTTAVSVFLTEGEEAAGGETGTPEAATGETAVMIENFAFDPDPLEITAGTTVTWTNMDSTAHTVSQDGGGFESGKLDQGATFSYTFDTPGTYKYFCQYHANMKGTIVVK
jgi:plastocyanin